MNNRFLGVKTLGDLYMVFSNEDIEYNHLSAVELDRLADVFEANIPAKVDMPDRPLTEAGYTLIWNVTVDTVEAFINNNNINTGKEAPEKEQEVIIMNNNATNDYITKEDLLSNMNAGLNSANETIDNATTPEEVETAAGKVDDTVDFIKGNFGKFLNILDVQFGCSALKDIILTVIRDSRVELEDSDDGEKGRIAFFTMAENCRKAVDNYINDVLLPLGKRQKAMQLKAMFQDNNGHCLFTKVFETLWWVGNKIAEKIQKHFPKVKEGGILSNILKGVKTLAKVLLKGVKIVLNVAKYTASFIVSGLSVAIDLLVSGIKTIVTKAKAWHEAKNAEKETAATTATDDSDDEALNTVIE